MAFGQELKDFASGFQIGAGIVDQANDRRDRKEARQEAREERESDKAYRRDRDAITDSQFAEGMKRRDEADKWARQRAGVQDELAASAAARDERRLRYYESGGARREGANDGTLPFEVEPAYAIPDGGSEAPEAPPTSDQQSSLEDQYTPDWLKYANAGAIRDKPLAPKLVRALDKVVPELGVNVKVFSGGQDGERRTGSHRHDGGNAGDIILEKDGRELSWENPKDRPIFEAFVSKAKQAGLTGFGAGEGYMRPGSMHVGFGSPAVWGAGGKGSNAADWLRTAYNGQPRQMASAGGYSEGGLVQSFALGGAIEDDQEQYAPSVISLGLADEAPQEEPQQVAQAQGAIPEDRVPTPMPRPEYNGAVTSQGNDTPDEAPTDDPYELGRRSVRDGLKRAMQDAGMNDQGAIDDPQSDNSTRKYLGGYGAAPRQTVQDALKAVDPEKKLTPGQRNMAVLAQAYKHYMAAGDPKKAQAAAASLVQFYRQESNRYLSLSQAAAQNGNLDAAAKAAVAAYANIPNGRDLKITKKDGGFEVSVTEDGKSITKKLVDPAQFGELAMGFNPGTFDEEILNAAGAPVEKFDELSPGDRQKLDADAIAPLAETASAEDTKLKGNVLSSVKTLASSIAGLKQNDMGAEQAFKLARAIAAASPGDYEVNKIRGNPDRVRVTIDGQTVVLSKNAMADLAHTGKVETEAKAKADEISTARNKKYKDAAEAFSAGVGQFQKQADENAAATRGAAIGTAIGAMAGKPDTQGAIPAPPPVASFDSPSSGDAGVPAAVPGWDEPAGGGVAIPDGGPQGDFKGLVQKGNIDLNKRPMAKNDDGTVSTVRSITITNDKGEAILIPTVAPSGTVLSNEAAIELYRRTGQHLGKFDNEKDAEAYAQALHESQSRRYAPPNS